MRPHAAVALATVLVLAGCSAIPGVQDPEPITPAVGTPEGTPGERETATPWTPADTPTTPAEDDDQGPTIDSVGWHGGYWANASLGVRLTDGLTADERAALVARTVARVEAVRGVDYDGRLNVSVRRSPADWPAVDGATRRYRDAMYEALFLVGSDRDGTTAYRESLLARGVWYEAATDSVVFAADAAPESELAVTRAVARAFQAQAHGPAPAGPLSDAERARTALDAGAARLTVADYSGRCGEDWTCAGSVDAQPPCARLDRVDSGLFLLDCYAPVDGYVHVLSAARAGGWDAVDALYDDPPNSTAAVTGMDAGPPESVALPVTGGDGWSHVPAPGSGTVGPAAIAVPIQYSYFAGYSESTVAPDLFVNLAGGRANATDPLAYALPPADGWRGDRLRVYRDGSDSGFVWRSTWANGSEAAEFRFWYAYLLRYWGGEQVEREGGREVWRLPPESPFAGAVSVRVDGATVTVVRGPERSDLVSLAPPDV
jgi:hypothetical protein